MQVWTIRLTILTLLLICFTAACYQYNRQPLPAEPSDVITKSHVVVIRTESSSTIERKIVSQGSGIIIGHKAKRTYILTAEHIRRSGKTKEGYVYEMGVLLKLRGTPIIARIERFSKHGLDAIVISTKTLHYPAARISKTDPAKPEELFVFGAPFGTYRKTYRRRVNRYRTARSSRRLHRQLKEFVLDGPIQKGFSGGGVFNSREKLVGMCYRTISVINKLGVCLPVSALKELIRQYQEE